MLQLKSISKNYSGELLFDGISFRLLPGEKVGLIGRNGSGKSTLLKIISGNEDVDSGSKSLRQGATVGYLSQQLMTENKEELGSDYIMVAKSHLLEIGKQLKELEEKFGSADSLTLEKLLKSYGKLQQEFEEQGGYVIESSIESICRGLGIENLLNRQICQMSGGEQTLIGLAKILVEDADVLLLDEPTNHLDFKGLRWLENYLEKSKKTCIIVSHDRYFLNNVVTRIVEIDDELVTYRGNYTYYQEEKAKQREILENNYDEQQKEIKKIKDAIRRYRQWGNESDNEKFYKRAKHLEKRLEQMDELSRPKKDQVPLLKSFEFNQRSGKEVVHFNEVSKCFESKCLFEGADFSVFWQDKLGIVGGNGVGKTTLLKIILNKIPVDSGEFQLGSNVEMGYLSQMIRYSRPKHTVLEEFRENCQLHEEESRRTLAKYLFFKEDVFRQVGQLSGGEKVRLELAKLMQQPNNLLILDEPTNHLDIETRELLEEVLQGYQGTIICVSHDRYFLSKITTRLIEVADKQVKSLNITIDEWLSKV